MKEVLAKAESKMGKTIARLESDYAAIRAGRSTRLQPFPLRRHAC